MTPEQRKIIEALPGWASPAKIDYVCEWINKNKASLVVEIGVYGGRLLLPMALAAKEWDGRTIGIDPWSVGACLEGMTTPANIEWWSKNADLERVFGACYLTANRLGLFDDVESLMLVPKTGDDAVSFVHTATFWSDHDGIDCLSIDGNHSAEPAMRDFKNYVPLVRSGGLIVADDESWTEGGELTVKPAIDWACSDGGCEYLCSVDGAAMLRKK
jgi:hypothetical protein